MENNPIPTTVGAVKHNLRESNLTTLCVAIRSLFLGRFHRSVDAWALSTLRTRPNLCPCSRLPPPRPQVRAAAIREQPPHGLACDV
jgi:hypothetical protein